MSYTSKDVLHLGFNPTIKKDNFTGFFVLGTCWGTYKQNLTEVKRGWAAVSKERMGCGNETRFLRSYICSVKHIIIFPKVYAFLCLVKNCLRRAPIEPF